MLPISICIGIGSLGFTIADAITNSILTTKGSTNKLTTTLITAFYTVAVGFLFAMSIVSLKIKQKKNLLIITLQVFKFYTIKVSNCIWIDRIINFILQQVPFASLHATHNATVPPQIRQLHTKINNLNIINNYNGIFRRVTGVDGRPEIIIEGSNSIDGPWKEYEFIYKPGNINNSLPLVAPHSPRLDWQMSFAALGTYQQNPWIMSLTYRLLNGEKDVLNLLNNNQIPFVDKPPKYIRGSLYHYHFSPWRKSLNDQRWWIREKVGEYFPIFSRDHTPLLDYLGKMKIVQDQAPIRPTNETFKIILDFLRSIVCKIEATVLLWSVFAAGCAIIMTSNSNTSPTKNKKK